MKVEYEIQSCLIERAPGWKNCKNAHMRCIIWHRKWPANRGTILAQFSKPGVQLCTFQNPVWHWLTKKYWRMRSESYFAAWLYVILRHKNITATGANCEEDVDFDFPPASCMRGSLVKSCRGSSWIEYSDSVEPGFTELWSKLPDGPCGPLCDSIYRVTTHDLSPEKEIPCIGYAVIHCLSG